MSRNVGWAAPFAAMGGNESSLGNRKVTFGLDEQDRVRVLQGIRVSRSEDRSWAGKGGWRAS